ncbi:MAG: peptidylprolyl isomerase [Burkholderiales bacterium]|nr:peptidylprolyl isomerase [Burkholderiales bacterium]
MKKLFALLAGLLSLPLMASGPHVLLNTNMGNIEIELNQAKAPVTVANFLNYVNSGQYNTEIFHRVVAGFVVQGGGYKIDLSMPATNAPIVNEASNGLKNLRGTIAMARTSDPNSATSEFYFNLVDSPELDYTGPTAAGAGYAVFGNVVNGMSVVDAMGQVPVYPDYYYTYNNNTYDLQDLPQKLLQINSAAVLTSYSATSVATGTIGSQTIQGTLIVPAADVGKTGSIYVAAILPSGTVYVLTPAGWQQYDPNNPVAYLTGALQSDTMTVVNGMNLTSLVGTNIFLGYGVGADGKSTVANMFASGHLSLIYTIH